MLNDYSTKERNLFIKCMLISLIIVPLAIILKYFLGYRGILYFDIAFLVITLIVIGYYYLFGKQSKAAFKKAYYLFHIYMAGSIWVLAFEDNKPLIDFLAGFIYLLPAFVCVLLYTFINKKEVKELNEKIVKKDTSK